MVNGYIWSTYWYSHIYFIVKLQNKQGSGK
jgi:hypothetical protein